jgi:hypothetical protein
MKTTIAIFIFIFIKLQKINEKQGTPFLMKKTSFYL